MNIVLFNFGVSEYVLHTRLSMSLEQQNKIEHLSRTVITHLSFSVLDAMGRKCFLTFGSKYFVFQNSMSDEVHPSLWKKIF